MEEQLVPIRQVVIITDCTDIAFNEMHQELRNLISEEKRCAIQVAPMAAVKNFSMINASFIIRLLADSFPAGETIFVVVVSGTSTNPVRILGRTKHGLRFVGNNSGYFDWLLNDFGLHSVYKNRISRSVDGRSFGGKYVQIPTAAKLIMGVSMEEIGQLVDKNQLTASSLYNGTVVHVDNFGLMKIKAPSPRLAEGESLRISVNNTKEIMAVYSEKMKCCRDGEWVLFPGSSLNGLPELGRVRSQNSAQELGVTEGDILTWAPGNQS